MSGPIKPQDRLAWHRQLSRDPELSHVVIHVGLAISNHFNNGSGETFIGMEKLAGEVGVHTETARKAVGRLARRGHLRVKKGGGRGWANTYSMVVREPYPLPKNTSRSAGVSDPKPQPDSPVNPSRSAGPTLKEENSKKESEGLSMKEASQPAIAPHTSTITAAEGARIGANGRAVLKVYSPQWQAWLRYHQATGDRGRANLMHCMADSSRWGEWEEVAEWPPTQVGPRDNVTA
jgi:hypothetical protein